MSLRAFAIPLVSMLLMGCAPSTVEGQTLMCEVSSASTSVADEVNLTGELDVVDLEGPASISIQWTRDPNGLTGSLDFEGSTPQAGLIFGPGRLKLTPDAIEPKEKVIDLVAESSGVVLEFTCNSTEGGP